MSKLSLITAAVATLAACNFAWASSPAAAPKPTATAAKPAAAAEADNTLSIIVPFSAGGPTDRIGRMIDASMEKTLARPVKVVNVAGAGGTVGVGRAVAAKPDGNTVLLMHIGISTAPTLYRSLKYDVKKDLEPLALVSEVPMMIVTRKRYPAKDFREFLAHAKANKTKVALANSGLGSASHLCGLMFMDATKGDWLTVPYKGTAGAMGDLVAGQVDFLCDQTTNTTGPLKGDKIKAMAVTTSARVDTMKDIPTLDESGLKGFSASVWHGMWAPKGTPPAAKAAILSALQTALKDEAVVKQLAELGTAPEPAARQTPAMLQAHLVAEIDRWKPVITKAGVFAD